MRKPKGYWSKKRLLELAKAKSYKEFNKNKTAYQIAFRLGILNEIKKITIQDSKKCNYYWNLDTLKEEAKKYNSKKEFRKENPSAYSQANRLGIMEQISYHFKSSGRDFPRYIYAIEFPDNSVYVGLSENVAKRLKQHTRRSHNNFLKDKFLLFGDRFNVVVFGIFESSKAKIKENEIEEFYKNKNYQVLNIAKTGSLGGRSSIWNEENIRIEMKKYPKKIDFYNNNISAYLAAKKIGLV